jgi:hypothetical protein
MNKAAMGNPLGQLLIGAGMVVVSLVVLLLNLKWISSVLEGPTEIKLADTQTLQDPRTLPNQGVSFRFDRKEETNLATIQKRSGQERSRYILIQVGDRWLLADVLPDFSGNRITGYVGTAFRQEAIEKVQQGFPQFKLLPFYIDAQYSQRGQCYAMLGVMGFFLVCGIVLSAVGLRGKLREAHDGY